jgi:predicted TIM-barrel fold metal-dependent hydrolase
MFGDDRLIFSVDYPFSDNRQARGWLDRLDLAPEVAGEDRARHRR